MTNTDVAAAERLIAKWKGVSASELSTSQSFLMEVCELLGVDRPHATAEQDYMFERPLTFQYADGSKSAGRVDLYRRGAFVLESKKLKAGAHTKGFDEAMLRAHSQAQNYARALPAAEGRPPFPPRSPSANPSPGRKTPSNKCVPSPTSSHRVPCRSLSMRSATGSLHADRGRSACRSWWRCWWRWEGLNFGRVGWLERGAETLHCCLAQRQGMYGKFCEWT